MQSKRKRIAFFCFSILLSGLFYHSTQYVFAEADGSAMAYAPPQQATVMLSTEMTPPLQAREDFFKNVDALKDKKAQEDMLRTWLADHTNDDEARFYLARVLSWEGNYKDSLSEYDQIRSRTPNNVDYILGNAQTLLWNNQPDDALALLNRGLELDPKYEDLYTVKIQTLSQLKRKDELKVTEEEAKRLFPNSQWVDEVEVAAAKPKNQLREHPLEVEGGYGFDSVTKKFASWNGQYITIKQPFSQRAGIYLQGNRTNRFDIQDYSITGGGYFPLSKKWGAALESSISPTGNVLPKWSTFGEVNRSLPWGFVAHAGFRHTEYQNNATELSTYTLENYWKHFRTSYTLYNNYLHNGGWSNSHVGQIEYYYGKHENSIGLTGALGNELVNLGPRGVVSTDVSALYLNGIQWVHPRIGVTYLLGVQKQGDFYTRRGLQFGLRYLF